MCSRPQLTVELYDHETQTGYGNNGGRYCDYTQFLQTGFRLFQADSTIIFPKSSPVCGRVISAAGENDTSSFGRFCGRVISAAAYCRIYDNETQTCYGNNGGRYCDHAQFIQTGFRLFQADSTSSPPSLLRTCITRNISKPTPSDFAA